MQFSRFLNSSMMDTLQVAGLPHIMEKSLIKCNMLITLAVIVMRSQSLAIVHGPTDYCFLEVFEPQCDQDEVILIKSALYGRMKVGKCVEHNSATVGCYADVLRVMDNLCSGKQSCSVMAINKELAATNPCGSKTKSSYLSVSYSCVKVSNLQQQCQNGGTIILSENKGFIAKNLNDNTCPVILTGKQGNSINITLYNFLKPQERSACYEIATIKDGNTPKTVHACENNERTKTVLVSSSPQVEIKFTGQTGQTTSILLYYEVKGCPHPPVPENGHAIREGDTATIVCNNSDTTWTTTCKDNKWTESERECPAGWTLTGLVNSSKEFPYGIFLTSIIGVSLGVLIGGFLLFLAINTFQRYQRRGQMYNPPPVIPDPDYKIYDTARLDLPFVPGYGHGTLPRHQMAAVDDAPPAPPPLSEATMKRLSRHTYERPNFAPP